MNFACFPRIKNFDPETISSQKNRWTVRIPPTVRLVYEGKCLVIDRLFSDKAPWRDGLDQLIVTISPHLLEFGLKLQRLPRCVMGVPDNPAAAPASAAAQILPAVALKSGFTSNVTTESSNDEALRYQS